MHRHVRIALLALALMVSLLATPGLSATDVEQRTYKGTYRWHEQERRNLTATFEATGADSWDVEIRYKYGRQRGRYRGTAEGRLGEGELTARVKAARGGKRYVIRGSWEDGIFRGVHYQPTRSGGEERTGTITLGNR